MQIKIVSWNIWGGKFIDGITSFLKDSSADVVFLQEVIKDTAAGNNALTIARALGYDHCVYDLSMKVSSRWTGPARAKEEILDIGNAVLSKYNIVASRVYNLSTKSKRRIAIQADLQVGDAMLHAFGVHLKHCHVRNAPKESETAQKEQTDTLVKLLPREKMVVAGDFNGTPDTYPPKQMASIFLDAETGSPTPTWGLYPEGCGTCMPTDAKYKFDYIFTSKDIRAKSFEVGKTKASDHLPVSAIVTV